MKTRLMLNMMLAVVSIVALTLTACSAAATPTAASIQGRITAQAAQPTSAPAAKEVSASTALPARPAEPTKAPAMLAAATATRGPAPTPAPVAVALRPGAATPVVVTPQVDLPPESMPREMFFKTYGVNPFIETSQDHLSTFAMDVDTASYTLMRKYINDGHLPPAESVRVEEYINYFNYDYPSPESGAFAIHLEGAPSPFGEGYYLLRVGLQGKRIDASQRKDAVLTFVIDVSGSMGDNGKLETVKQALEMLVNELRPTDQVGIVVFTTQARVVLEPTPASNKSAILSAIRLLRPENTTNVEHGLSLGYSMASRAYRKGAINHVILCSDGVANVASTNANAILAQAKEYATRDITLSTVGVGMGTYNDVLLEQLADKGNGNYAYVDTLDEAHRVFVENLTGMLQVIAQDAKVQVDFNPAVVTGFRLIGYENRAVDNQDFRNDAVDAGEVGAGHNVTALYEVKFNDNVAPSAKSNALTVYVRYQDIEAGKVREINQPFARAQFASKFEATSPHFQLAAAVAEYAEILRVSYWAKGSHLQNVQSLAQRVGAALANDKDVAEFVQLVSRASQLSG
jgi:Ca-activated chloride channel family protein